MYNKIFYFLFVATFPRLFATVIIGMAAFGSYNYQKDEDEKADLAKKVVVETVLECDNVESRDGKYICMEYKQ